MKCTDQVCHTLFIWEQTFFAHGLAAITKLRSLTFDWRHWAIQLYTGV
jgi:hypothetical protein